MGNIHGVSILWVLCFEYKFDEAWLFLCKYHCMRYAVNLEVAFMDSFQEIEICS